MGTVRHEIVIDAPAYAAWDVVTDAGNLHTWFPGLVDSRLEDDLRTIVADNGLEMPERIITNDPLLRRFQYQIEAPLFRHHLGTIDVIELSDDQCIAVYSTDCDPSVLALAIGGASADALQNLKTMCEGAS